MPLAKSFKFNNGLSVPAVGLGTWVCRLLTCAAAQGVMFESMRGEISG